MHTKVTSNWLVWAVIFLIIAIVTGVLGFGVVSGVSFTIAKWLAVIFLILFIVSVLAHTIKKS